MTRCPSEDWDRYCDQQERAELWAVGEKIAALLTEQNQGRNLQCWPIMSFGWKDADLDPDGCCGIAELIDATDDKIVFKIGGHKTFSDPSEEMDDGEQREACQAECQAAIEAVETNCEWDGDSWIASFEDEISVPLIFSDADGDVDQVRTASDVEQLARDKCDEISAHWSQVDQYFNEIYSRYVED